MGKVSQDTEEIFATDHQGDLQILLSNSKAWSGRSVEQEQELEFNTLQQISVRRGC